MSAAAASRIDLRALGGALIGALLVAACSSAPPPSGTPAGGLGASSNPTTSQLPGDSPALGTLPPGFVTGSGPFVASDTAAGLTDLTSYTATLTKSFDGTVDGAAQRWSSTIRLSVGAAGSHLAVTTEGTGAIEIPGEIYEIDGIGYQVAGDSACNAGVIETPGAVRTESEPANQLYGVVGGDPAGDETINGVAATHVTFDERAIGLAGLVKATGALWNATAGSYLLRYSLTTEGGPDFFGAGTTGTQTWQYELGEVNQPVSIDLPADCPAGKVGAEVMPGATDVVDGPGLLMYSVAGSITEAINFYKSKEAGAGWTQLQEPLINEQLGVLELTSAEGKVTVLVTAVDAGHVSVHVALDRAR